MAERAELVNNGGGALQASDEGSSMAIAMDHGSRPLNPDGTDDEGVAVLKGRRRRRGKADSFQRGQKPDDGHRRAPLCKGGAGGTSLRRQKP